MDGKPRIEAVHRAQAYIEAHLHEPITLLQLARAAGFSPWHTSRIFKAITGKTPFEYIRFFRLSQAAARLATGEEKIVDVAFDFVFDSHEGFTKAFSRRFGMSPSQFRKTRPKARLFLPPRARELDLSREKGAQFMPTREQIRRTDSNAPNTVFVQVLDRQARKLIVRRGVTASNYHDYCKEVGCDVWDDLSAVEEALNEPMGMWLPDNLRTPGTSEYVQGVEVAADYAGALAEGFEAIDAPACKLMVFQGQPFADEDFEEAIGSLREVIAGYDPTINGYAWADADGPRFQLIPLGYRGYIEGRPVRQLS